MRALSLLLVAPACFSPSPPTGVPCQVDPDCPPPQVCDLATQTCQLTSSPADAAIDPDVPPDAPAFDCWDAWKSGNPVLSAPQIATSLNSSARDQDPSFTLDALGVYVVRGDVIMFATRPNRAADFDPPDTVTELMSGDGETRLSEVGNRTIAVFESRRAGGAGGPDLWFATRSGVGAAWNTPSQLGFDTVNTADSEFDPEAMEDTLRLYWSAPVTTLGPRGIFFATRANTGAPFGDAVELAIDVGGAVSDPAVSPDELVLVFAAPSNGVNDIHFATRTSKTAPFTSHGKLDMIDSIASNGDPDLSADGCTLIFGSDRIGGQGNRDLYISEIVPPSD